MSSNDYRHIHHIISMKPLPLLNPNETNHALHYTQTIDDGNETSSHSRLLYRRVHLNDLPDYLLHDASKQLRLQRLESPSISSTSQNDDDVGYFTNTENETRSHSSLSFKRQFENDSTLSNKQYILKERIIPVRHEYPIIAQDEKTTTWTMPLHISTPAIVPVATAPPIIVPIHTVPPPAPQLVPVILYQQQPIRFPTVIPRPPPPPPPPPPPQVIVQEHHHHHHYRPLTPPPEPASVPVSIPPPPAPLTTTEITETIRRVRRRPRIKAVETIIEQKAPAERIQTGEITVERRRQPQVAFEEIEIQSDPISKPIREVIVEHHDTILIPQEKEIIQTEIPSTVEIIDTKPITKVEKETVEIPIKPKKVIKGK